MSKVKYLINQIWNYQNEVQKSSTSKGYAMLECFSFSIVFLCVCQNCLGSFFKICERLWQEHKLKGIFYSEQREPRSLFAAAVADLSMGGKGTLFSKQIQDIYGISWGQKKQTQDAYMLFQNTYIIFSLHCDHHSFSGLLSRKCCFCKRLQNVEEIRELSEQLQIYPYGQPHN